jgi:hypothetical protein
VIKDVSDRAGHLPRNCSFLYPPRNRDGPDPCDYIGVLRLETGETFWVLGWHRYVKGKPVFELRLNLKSASTTPP